MHADWAMTPQRAAVHLPTATAVVADLHLGYNAARQRGGEAVPDPGPTETLAPLRSLFERQLVRRLLIAGDLFERAYDADLVKQLLAVLETARVEMLGLVPGNHDRGLNDSRIFPVHPDGFRLGAWLVVHGDGELPCGPLLCGHFHPCVRWGNLTAVCFLVSKQHIVIPAFSRDAAGVNVVGDPRWGDYRCLVPVGQEVLDFGRVNDLTRSRSGPRRGGRP
jgi:putative SbcD/Mre11-related phosphoesterase